MGLRLSSKHWVIGLVYAGLLAALFWPTFLWMQERFTAYDSFYSHGWLVPLASAGLLWQRRRILEGLSLAPSAGGLCFLVASIAVHVIATWLKVGFASGFALVGAVWGIVWALWGLRALWMLRFPMLFLLFMVPLPGILLIAASFKMKMLAAGWATALLNAMSIQARQLGSSIQVPNVTVIVDDTCSGLRSLISLIALSVIWTAVLPKRARPWQKWALVAASIPIALCANMVRIMVLVLIATTYGPEAAEGYIHYGSGFVVFGIAIAALAWLGNQMVPDAGEGPSG